MTQGDPVPAVVLALVPVTPTTVIPVAIPLVTRVDAAGSRGCDPLSGETITVGEMHLIVVAEVPTKFGQSAQTPDDIAKPIVLERKILPLRTKLLISLGESVQGIWVTIAGFFLNIYFLEVCCLDPATVSLIQLIQGLFDAFNDPLIGYLSDHTRTRWGRRRPWLLFGGPFLAVSYFFLWSKAPDDWSDVARFMYYLLSYMGVSIGVTCVQIQIAALVPELTDDYNERTVIGACRILAVIISGLITVVGHGCLIGLSDSKEAGYRVSGGVFAVIIVICSWTVFSGIRETFIPEQEVGEKLSIAMELKTLFRNRAFWCVVIVYLCGPTAVVLVQSNLFMYCKYVVKNENLVWFIIIVVQGSAVVTAPLWVLFANKFGKREVYFVGGPILIVALMCIGLVREEFLAVLLGGVVGSCLAIVYLAPYSMLPDVIEDDELRTGKRREGLFAGFFTVSLKLTVTFAMTCTNLVLKATGYRSPRIACGFTDNNDDGSLPDSQPDGVISSIMWLVGPIPAVCILTGMFFAWAYPITRESHAVTAAQVKIRRLAAIARLQAKEEARLSVIEETAKAEEATISQPAPISEPEQNMAPMSKPDASVAVKHHDI